MTTPTTTQPSEQAMKAADVVWHQIDRGLHDGTLALAGMKVLPPPDKLAYLIDRETGLPALLAENKQMRKTHTRIIGVAGWLDDDDADFLSAKLDRIADLARAALAEKSST